MVLESGLIVPHGPEDDTDTELEALRQEVEAGYEDVERLAAEDRLYTFVQQAWPILEPTTPFVPGWHIEAVCEHLEAVSRRQIRNLTIEIPPRSSKSTIVSVLWPAWEWIHWPSRRFLTASYSLGLAIRDALRSRRVLNSPWYKARWGQLFTLAYDQNVKGRYENDRTGVRLAISGGSLTTGEGGDTTCFPAEELVWTEHGPLPIGRIVERRLSLLVWSLDTATGQYVQRPITARQPMPGSELVRVHLSDGTSLACTPDHHIWTRAGWVEAQRLLPSDLIPDEALAWSGSGPASLWRHHASYVTRRNVLRVEPAGSAPAVYCLTVQGTHTFLAGTGAIPVHNCLDDPHNITEAESLVKKRSVIHWHDEAFYNRVNDAKTGARVVVGQRVAPDDLIGHLRRQGGWEHLCIPEEYETARCCHTSIGWHDKRKGEPDGTLMRPQRFGPAEVADAKQKLGTFAYQAQYQQRPTPREGALFKRHWWQRYVWMGDHYRLTKDGRQIFPARCQRVGVVDPAGGTSEGADHTAITFWDITPDRKAVLRHAHRARVPVEDIPRLLKSQCDEFRPLYVLVEAAFLQTAIVRACRAVQGMPAVRAVDPGGKSKFMRAVPAIVKAEAGELIIPDDLEFPWLEDWLHEHDVFTGSGNDARDDLVDCTSYLALDMQQGVGAGAPPMVVGENAQSRPAIPTGMPMPTRGGYGGVERDDRP